MSKNQPITQSLKENLDAPRASGFVERELWRIQKAIKEKLETSKYLSLLKDVDYNKLQSATQALAWVLEPSGVKSPFDAIMGTQAEPEDCSVEYRPPLS